MIPFFGLQSERGERWGYALLLNQFRPEAKVLLPVKIVDVTGMPRPEASNNPGVHITDRHRLLQVLTKLAAQKPRAIGVDCNFALEASGEYVDDWDSTFFGDVVSLTRKYGVPIFLGVYPRKNSTAWYYIGKDIDKITAAVIISRSEHQGGTKSTERETQSENDEEVRYMPLWYGGTKEKPRSTRPTMAAALVGASLAKDSRFAPSYLWAPGLTYYFDDTLPSEISDRKILVDYSIIDSLNAQKTSWRQVVSSVSLPHRFSGSIVLVGEAAAGLTTNPDDAFFAPGFQTKIPGVYLHACSVYSALQSPLYGLKWGTVTLLDLALVLLIFWVGLGFERLLEWRGKHIYHEFLVEAAVVVVVSLVALLVVPYFVVHTRAMWGDFLVALLLLHVDLIIVTARNRGIKRWHSPHDTHNTSPQEAIESLPHELSTQQPGIRDVLKPSLILNLVLFLTVILLIVTLRRSSRPS